MKIQAKRIHTLSMFFSLAASLVFAVSAVAQSEIIFSEANAQTREIASVGQPRFQTVPSCMVRPEFLNESKVEVYEGLAGIPEGLLVARKAQFYVESHATDGTPIRIHSEQKFVDADNRSPQSRVVCGFANATIKKSFATYGLTLLDLRPTKAKNSAVWQFQMAVGEGKYGVWNHKSDLLLKRDEKTTAQDILSSLGGGARVYKVGNLRYEILVLREAEGTKQYFSIVYDLKK